MTMKNENGDGISILSFGLSAAFSELDAAHTDELVDLDSGGPGTYSQLLIVKEYMNRIAVDLEVSEDDVFPADYYDLMGGVGFGGLAAIMLGHLRMNVNQAIDAVLTIASTIFSGEPGAKPDLALNAQNLREAVENMLLAADVPLDTRMNDQRRPSGKCKVALYAAASADLGHPRALRTYASRLSSFNPTIVEAVCATMSNPSLFLPTKIGAGLRKQEFVGGAIGVSNPTRELLNEAASQFGRDHRVAQIISIGAGAALVSLNASSAKTRTDQLLQGLSADCEVVAKELSTRLFTVDAYLRLNVERGMEEVTMTDWSCLGSIESRTITYVETTAVAEALEASLSRLRSKMGSLSLGQINHTSSIKVTAKQPPVVSPYHVARKAPWDLMVNHLITSPHLHQRIFPITGMGGCGKTQLVSYFLRGYRSSYKHVVFVDASSISSLQSDLQTWARSLGDGHEHDVWEDGLRFLTSTSDSERLVLILDNADDPTINLTPYLPDNKNVNILITSRNRTLGNLSTTYHLELGELETEEALTTLLNAARRQLPLPEDDMKNARTLLEELGCLAVAIVQAGTYCYELSSTVQPYTFTQYLHLFYNHRADLMKKAEPSSLDNYQRGAYAAFDLSYNVIPGTARTFLHFISFFHFTDIPLAALETATKKEFEDIESNFLPRPDEHQRVVSTLKETLCADGKWNALQVQETIRILRSFSLLSVTSVDDSVFIQMHPLVQSWARDSAGSDSKLYGGMAVQILTSCCNIDNHQVHRYLMSHILDMLSRDTSPIMHVNDRMSTGRILYQRGKYQSAIESFKGALKAMGDATEENLRNRSTVEAWLAEALRTMGQWDEAEKLEVNILEQRKKALGLEDMDTILGAANLARTYQSRGRFAEAEELRVDVLEKSRRLRGMHDRGTLTAAANLATTYRSRDRLEDAEKLELEVLEQRRKILGNDHPDTIVAAANLAVTYQFQARWNDAEKLEVEVLEQQRRVLGYEHPHTIMAASNLGSTYHMQRRWVEAEALQIEVLEQRRRILGMEHPDTVTSAAHLASTYHSQLRWAESEALKVQVLEQRRRILGMAHPDTILAQTNLAATYGAQGRLEDQIRLLATAVQLALKAMGQSHPTTQSLAQQSADLYKSLGQEKEEEEMRLLITKD